MKHCKRIVTLVLMLALVLALSVAAYATEADSSASDLYDVIVDANGGNFADGLTGHEYELDLSDENCLDELEIPYWDGYFFVGWMDYWDTMIEEPEDILNMSGDTLYAKWQGVDDPSPLRAEIIATNEDDFAAYVLWGYEAHANVWLEADKADAEVVMYVTYPDGTEESWPITFDGNGHFTKTITVKSYDGTQSRKYRVDVELEQPRTEPEDLHLEMYVGERNPDYSPLAIEEGSNIINAVMSGNYGVATRYLFEYFDVDDKWHQEEIFPEADGSATYTFTSANGQTYQLNIRQDEPTSDISFNLDVWFDDEDESGWSDFYNCQDFEDGKLTITVPYGVITDADGNADNELNLYIYPNYGTYPGFEEDGNGDLCAKLPVTPGTDIVKTFTAIAPDGVTKYSFTVTVVEASADNTELDYIETYGDDENYYFSEMLDIEAAASAAGVTVKLPYGFNSENVYLFAGSNTGSRVYGLEEDGHVILEADGTTTVQFKVTSPNGKKSQTYTVHYVIDTKGDTVKAQFVLHWMIHEMNVTQIREGELIADMEAAATEAGAVIYLDRAIHEDLDCIQICFVEAEDYGTITQYYVDMAGNEAKEEQNSTCFMSPYSKDEDQAVYWFTVTSPNGKHSQDYKVTVVYCDDHTYVGGKCSKCGAEGEVVEPGFDIAFANMTLGNSLAMNFAFSQENMDNWNGCYAKVVKTYADGRADKVVTIPASQWGTAKISGVQHYTLKFDGVAAKEMSDSVYVTIYDAAGNAISNVWEDSVRSYAMRTLNNPASSLETQIMIVDLLNYGAAAQSNFGYNTADLANNQLSAAQKTLATQSVVANDSRVKGDNYKGTNLGLESQILMRYAFGGTTEDMYAIISFTSHTGKENNIRVEGSEFASNGGAVVIDEIVIADGRQPVTITVYNADGTVYGSATDSLESYIARMSDAGALYEMILKFSDSAYNFFH